jgi:tartrate-resistant acid phosphatase type 5
MRSLFSLIPMIVVVASGCGGSDEANTSSNTGAGGPAGGSSSDGGGGSANTGGNVGSGGSGGSGGGAPSEIVRFVAMGDGGEGNGTQLQVAQAIRAECDARGGCEFALYLGDNIYNSGADSVMDAQFQSKFEVPYSELLFPFYITLGNHDYGGGGTGFEFWKGDIQVDYTQYSSKWTLPSKYYRQSIVAGATTVDMLSLDTNSILYAVDLDQQKSWFQGELAASTATWKLAFGHHTYVSNGAHGNAGEYEGIPGVGPCSTLNILGIPTGVCMKQFFDENVCGQVDAYICGHDHNRQWLEPTCGTEFMVSGTAAKTTDLANKGTATLFETDQLGGYLLVEISGNSMTGWFYDENGNEEFTRTITK